MMNETIQKITIYAEYAADIASWFARSLRSFPAFPVSKKQTTLNKPGFESQPMGVNESNN